jgi:hypothetical protein
MFQAGGRPRVRALHASPDAPPVDIFVDGSKVIANLSYGQLSSYAELPEGRHNVKVFAASSGGQGKTVIDTDVNLDMGKDYTVAATGTLHDIKPVVMLDSTAAPGRNRAKVRVFHASPDAPPVDVAAPNGPTLFKDVSFGSVTPFEEVDSGKVSLAIRRSGTTQMVMNVPNFNLDGGTLYTFVALGLVQGSPPFMILPIADSGRMRTGMGM